MHYLLFPVMLKQCNKGDLGRKSLFWLTDLDGESLIIGKCGFRLLDQEAKLS